MYFTVCTFLTRDYQRRIQGFLLEGMPALLDPQRSDFPKIIEVKRTGLPGGAQAGDPPAWIPQWLC